MGHKSDKNNKNTKMLFIKSNLQCSRFFINVIKAKQLHCVKEKNK